MYGCVFFFKKKTAYGWRIVAWSSDVCSSDLEEQVELAQEAGLAALVEPEQRLVDKVAVAEQIAREADARGGPGRVIVDAVDHLRRAVRQEARHRADHIVVDALAVGGGQRIANLGIALHRVDEKDAVVEALPEDAARSEEHTSELQSLMRISYAVFC